MAQTAAEAVADQRIKRLETMCENLTKRVEVMKVVLKFLAKDAGKD